MQLEVSESTYVLIWMSGFYLENKVLCQEKNIDWSFVLFTAFFFFLISFYIGKPFYSAIPFITRIHLVFNNEIKIKWKVWNQ